MTIDEAIRTAVREELDRQLAPIRERLDRPRGSFRPDEAGDYLGYSETTIRELMRSGELAYIELGRTKRVTVVECDRWLAERSRRRSGVA